jgi:TetR/AcrR family transcriptional regulator, regulator of cefoperazone and chloramphenicol sensitivity
MKSIAVTSPNESTRQRITVAAVELFGKYGYHGVGAREIATAAGAQLSAIPYHFGTKESLYREALQHICEELNAALSPAALIAQQSLDKGKEEAAAALHELQLALLEVIAASPQAQSWAKLLLREHLDPSSAFDIVDSDAGSNVVNLMAQLIARIRGVSSTDKEVVLEAFTCMGQVMIFRILSTSVKRRMGWATIEAPQVKQISRALTKHGLLCPADSGTKCT